MKEKCEHLIALKRTHDDSIEIYESIFKKREKDKIKFPKCPWVWEEEYKDLNDLMNKDDGSEYFLVMNYCGLCGEKVNGKEKD